MAVTVTAVDADGSESLPARFAFMELSENYTLNAGSLKIAWTKVTGAKHYNVYRSIIANKGADIEYGAQMGFIGKSFSTEFTDNNIVPDFKKAPPTHVDPFVDASITGIEITNAGSSYAKADTVSVSGSPGTGFVGFPSINAAGDILSVIASYILG